ncbi:trihelix transcription factor PTL [Lactuca sativa]|uniref:Myb-like domain-containing protein n=1 Tax=Lactuca sativa TaxID=4236 RepID=A0A9R1WLP6_LACSA|nr:trihelix transcription factor PTL [Lactuca sativa]KAJ0226049.1 hypothetical protein LSAT_V11C100020630 [Lactuca sativa]
MDETYGLRDLSHYMNGTPIFPSISLQPQTQPPRDLHYAMVMLGGGPGGGGMSFGSDSTMGMGSTASGLSADSGGGGGSGGGCGGNGLEMEIDGYGGRWTREETLTLLEIRSGLDSMFKEANHKGPVWDEVSRIMSVEHGYRRSGKKCCEKFENLYKYYKKIKGGKAGRQDKKHYRFFSQLEALYGETNASTNQDQDPNLLSVSNNLHLPNNPSVFDPSSCDFVNHYAPLAPFKEESDCVERTDNKKSLGKKYWKTMITDFIETKTQTLMEKQDAWMEKMMRTIDEKEKERISKEKQWRKENAARLEIEKKLRAKERAWMESRDSALMEALHKLTENKSCTIKSSSPEHSNDQNHNIAGWGENEITHLIQLRTSMETRFEQGGCMEEVLWEEIALSMACLGYNRNALICKTKWDHINFQLRTKKRKENTRCSNLYSHHNNIIHQVGERSDSQNDPQNDGGYRALMNDPALIGNYYGNKITKGEKY